MQKSEAKLKNSLWADGWWSFFLLWMLSVATSTVSLAAALRLSSFEVCSLKYQNMEKKTTGFRCSGTVKNFILKKSNNA